MNHKDTGDYFRSFITPMREVTETSQGIKLWSLAFPPDIPVKTVSQDCYGIKEADETLVTYGITNCCGIAACTESRGILFHCSACNDMQEVIDILDKFVGEGTETVSVVIAPGSSCKAIEYKLVASDCVKKNRMYRIHRFLDDSSGIMVIDDNGISIEDVNYPELFEPFPIKKRNYK